MKFLGLKFKDYSWFDNTLDYSYYRECMSDNCCRPLYFLTKIIDGIKSECKGYPNNLLANIFMLPISAIILIGIIFMIAFDIIVFPFKFLWSLEFKIYTIKKKLKKKEKHYI